MPLSRNLVGVFHKFSDTNEEPDNAKPTPNQKPDEEGEVEKVKASEALEEEVEEARQREHFERTASTLRHKLNKGEESRYSENLRIMHENVLLLTEINILRKDFQASRLRTQRLLGVVQQSELDGDDSPLIRDVLGDQFKSEAPLMLLKSDVTKPLSLPALHNK